MIEIDVREMLEAGVHFGHKKDRWNPKMRPFIFTERNGVHIFDLIKTKEALEAAEKKVSQVAADGGTILFVGTKNQVKSVVKQAAEKASMPYLAERWPGGMLTNFNTILGRLKYMKDAESTVAQAVADKENKKAALTKKELLNLTRELEKLSATFEGVKDLRRLPDMLFVVDLVKEKNAVREAKILGIPVVGIADSNANPDIEYPIPGNDDAVRAVKYIVDKIAEGVAGTKKAQIEMVEATEAETKEEPVELETDPVVEKKEMDWEEKAKVKRSKPKEEEKEESKK